MPSLDQVSGKIKKLDINSIISTATTPSSATKSQNSEAQNLTKNNNGYVGNFICQPEPFLNSHAYVFKASNIPTRKSIKYNLDVVKIHEIFSGTQEVFLGIGDPNTFLVIPDKENGGYKKFDAKSAYREVAKISPIKNGDIQSGVIIRFKLTDDLRGEVIKRIDESMKKHSGKKNITCVQANCTILEDAGFKHSDYPLNQRRFSSEILAEFGQDKTQTVQFVDIKGISHDVKFEMARTTGASLEQHYKKVLTSQSTAIPRHTYRALSDLQTAIFGANISFQDIKWNSRDIPTAKLMESKPYHKKDLESFASVPSNIGYALRQIWGAHTIYGIKNPQRVNINKFFNKKLKSFTPLYIDKDNNIKAFNDLTSTEVKSLGSLESKFKAIDPDFVTKLKSGLLFNSPRISMMQAHLSNKKDGLGQLSESTIYNMLGTHSKEAPRKHNIVITPKEIKLERIYENSKVSWVLSKHRLIAGNKEDESGKLLEEEEDVLFAGEICKKEDGKLYLNGNSGTYKPTVAMVESAVKYLKAVMPHVEIVNVGMRNLDDELDEFIKEN
jgi:hypothetical protein